MYWILFLTDPRFRSAQPSRRSDEFLGLECPHEDVNNQLQCDGPGAIQQHIPGSAGAVGQEALMPLIAAGYQRRAKQGENCVLEKAGMGQSHPPGAQPSQSDEPIDRKMPAFADVVMQNFPSGVTYVTEDPQIGRASCRERV